MDLNRNQFFFLGMIILLIGLQFRCVSAYVLNPQTTQFIAERTGQAPFAESQSMFTLASSMPSSSRRIVRPPDWLGWCLISIGAVLALHSLAMKKPD